jgi:hypothetical protein
MQEFPAASGSRRSTRFWRVALLVPAAFGLFSLFIWTAGLAVGWHLVCGKSISFEGQRIPVPWDMFAIHSPDRMAFSMVRWAAPFPILRSPAGLIFISRNPGATPDSPEHFDRLAQALARSPNGYRLQAVRKLTVAKGTATCWEDANVDSSSISISCLFDKDNLSASLEGSPTYREPFYRALELVSKGQLQSK